MKINEGKRKKRGEERRKINKNERSIHKKRKVVRYGREKNSRCVTNESKYNVQKKLK